MTKKSLETIEIKLSQIEASAEEIRSRIKHFESLEFDEVVYETDLLRYVRGALERLEDALELCPAGYHCPGCSRLIYAIENYGLPVCRKCAGGGL